MKIPVVQVPAEKAILGCGKQSGLWRPTVRDEIKMFAWRAGLGIILTMDNLHKRKVVSHALMDCSLARKVWDQVKFNGVEFLEDYFHVVLLSIEGKSFSGFSHASLEHFRLCGSMVPIGYWRNSLMQMH